MRKCESSYLILDMQCPENCWKSCDLELRTMSKETFSLSYGKVQVDIQCQLPVTRRGNGELNCFLEHPVEFISLGKF